jgi:hypothetical protein
MSLAGMIMRDGATVTVYHGLDTETADGGSARTYPTNTPDVGMLLEDLSDELLRRVFGPETKATLRAYVTDSSVVLNKGDGVTVTAGPHAGERFRIDRVLGPFRGASPHRQVGLAATTESFT